MISMKKMKLDKNLKSSLITYGMVVVFYVVMQTLVMTGNISSLMKGLLVPLCIYSIMAVALNLTVGILGELSLGHAGFMCIGAFAGAFFSKCMNGAMPDLLRFICALLIGAAAAALFGFLIGIPVLRLKGDYLAIVTLGFGEIIKNLVNVFYVGRDSEGLHFSMKDAMSLNMLEDGEDQLVLNSVNTLGRVMDQIGEYEQINCYLDNDNAGRRTLEILRNHFGDKVKDCSGLYKGEKDLNEYLQNRTLNL